MNLAPAKKWNHCGTAPSYRLGLILNSDKKHFHESRLSLFSTCTKNVYLLLIKCRGSNFIDLREFTFKNNDPPSLWLLYIWTNCSGNYFHFYLPGEVCYRFKERLPDFPRENSIFCEWSAFKSGNSSHQSCLLLVLCLFFHNGAAAAVFTKDQIHWRTWGFIFVPLHLIIEDR